MSEQTRFQFGLRRMLLWTVVIAVWLGLLKQSGLPWPICATRTYVLLFCGFVRVAIGPKKAVLVPFVICAIYALLAIVSRNEARYGFEYVFFTTLVEGLRMGMPFFLFVEISFRGVDWIDRLLESRKAEGNRRE